MIRKDRTLYVVAGLRRCVLIGSNQDFLLVLYEDNSGNSSGLTVQNGYVIINYSLNYSAAVLWYLLKDCPRIEEIPHLLKKYCPNVDSKQIILDVDNFLNVLYELKFIDFIAIHSETAVSPFMLASSLKEENLFAELYEYVPFHLEPIAFPENAYTGPTSGAPCGPYMQPPTDQCTACVC